MGRIKRSISELSLKILQLNLQFVTAMEVGVFPTE
jgi:hypothetical protein